MEVLMGWRQMLVVGVGLMSMRTARADELRAPQKANAEVSTTQSGPLTTRAAVADMQGNPEQARELANQAIRANPRDPWPYYNKGMALAQLGETDGALAALFAAEQHFAQTDRWGRSVAIYGRAHALKYDAPRFSAAMERAIELTDDDTFQGDLYADLAHDTAGRGGMFPVLPATEVVEGWVDRALELAKPGSRAAAKALLARSHWRRSRGISTGLQEAIDASALVVGIDDPDLEVVALNDLVLSSVVAGE